MEEINLKEIIANGAIVLDVRTTGEYAQDHAKGSINVPLPEIYKAMLWLLKDVPIITCCATGSRSAVAKEILEFNGYQKVYNGGSWNSMDGLKLTGSCPVRH